MMKVVPRSNPPLTLAEFCEREGLVINMEGRVNLTGRFGWLASVVNLEVKDGAAYHPAQGAGTTPEAALEDLRRRLSGQPVVYHPVSQGVRREFRAPPLKAARQAEESPLTAIDVPMGAVCRLEDKDEQYMRVESQGGAHGDVSFVSLQSGRVYTVYARRKVVLVDGAFVEGADDGKEA